jgi:hypothetical protein
MAKIQGHYGVDFEELRDLLQNFWKQARNWDRHRGEIDGKDVDV